MELDIKEPLRYLGVRGDPDPALYAEISAVANKLIRRVQARYLYRVFPVERRLEGIALTGSGLILTGEMARSMLSDCGQAVLLICTLGAGFEALLRAEQARSMARAAMLDACGSAWVEAGCDEAEREIAARFPGLYLTDRFSPGYGDLPLSLQKDICALLDASRRLGVQVTDSFLMNPSKSVTAVAGLAVRPQAVGRPPDRSLGRSPSDDPQAVGRPPDRSLEQSPSDDSQAVGRPPDRSLGQSPNDDPQAAGRPPDRSLGRSPSDDPQAVGRPPDRSLGRSPNDDPQPARVRGCGFCNLRENCQYRKEGKTCGS